MLTFREIKEALLHLAFPHTCAGCGTDLTEVDHQLCIRCLDELPATNFHHYSNNPVEKIFWGRVPVTHATALYYFTSPSLVQHLMHQLKYRGNKELGLYLGRLMGHTLQQSNRFLHVDALVPLPLSPEKERKRGYNQSALLCQGIAEILKKPVWTNAVSRTRNTESQTRKNRIGRWQNMEGGFKLMESAPADEKHLLLVDDVITTGATLEACARSILQGKGTRVSIATLCFSSR